MAKARFVSNWWVNRPRKGSKHSWRNWGVKGAGRVPTNSVFLERGVTLLSDSESPSADRERAGSYKTKRRLQRAVGASILAVRRHTDNRLRSSGPHGPAVLPDS